MFIQENNRFYMGDKSHPQAEITFVSKGDDELSIDHTFVDNSLRGQGLAQKLVDAVADFARSEGKKLSATCPYAVKRLETDEKYADITK